MIRARTLSNASLHRVAFLTAAAVAISTLAGCSSEPTPSAGEAEVLSFEGLDYPSAIDVDSAGNVYITDWGNDRVLNLANGSNTQSTIPFDSLTSANGIAVGNDGNVYVSDGDSEDGRVLQMSPNSTSQKVLATASHPTSLVVDDAGTVYVYDFGAVAVRKIVRGAKDREREYAFLLGQTNLANSDEYFNDVAIGSDGKLHVLTGMPGPQIYVLKTDTVLVELPVLRGQDRFPTDIDINSAGDMVILDGKHGPRILKVAHGSTDAVELSFGELNKPSDVAISDSGDVFVADRNNHRVLKLQAKN
ncbi:hypothetical protein [Rhodococcus sp. ARC_M6]|uniref:hypothetical protein n=1 Tax=Rhodococcus sp. ARC_M6 TaxID=2928852 RepID=UPI001FB26DFA|nr:hypothetical protein [Rhodococcus sp. ARC_M6]MCJ0907473.1 hypothetical protein [Rhodococcus sp. ARC_M6]